jgi:hypothetical protein
VLKNKKGTASGFIAKTIALALYLATTLTLFWRKWRSTATTNLFVIQ